MSNSEQAKSVNKIFLCIDQAIELIIDVSQRQRSNREAHRPTGKTSFSEDKHQQIKTDLLTPFQNEMQRHSHTGSVTCTRAPAYTRIHSANERACVWASRSVRVICRRRRLPAVARRRIVSAFGDEMSSEFDTVRRTRLAPVTFLLLLRVRYPLLWKPWRQRLRLFWLAGRRARRR